MKAKKIAAFMISAAMISASLAGCGSGGESTSTETTAESTAESTEASTAESTETAAESTNSGMPDGSMGTPPDGSMGERPEGGGEGGAPGGSSSASDITYTAVTTYDSDTTTDGETYTSTGTDENAVLVDNGASVTIKNATVTRTSSDSTGGDNSSFYGVGAALFAKDGTLHVTGANITTDAEGGAGVFSYGDSVVYVSDSTISTEQNTSGGIHVAGGGTLYAYDLDVTTNGGSAAAVRSDRGGGTMVVDGGSYTSNGTGSPAVYTTADITINNADLEATNSEAICIEGLNTLRLYDCDLTGNMPDDDQNDITWTVILYQSMSGDSEVGCSEFDMVGGTLTSKKRRSFLYNQHREHILPE